MAPTASKQGDGYYARDTLGTLLRNWRVRAVLPHIHGTLVDLACGDNHIVGAHGKGVGVDVAVYSDPDVLAVESLARIPLADGYADTVSIIASLNYFDDPVAVLR